MKIKVACDGSAQSEHALRLTARLPLKNPEFELISVAPEVHFNPDFVSSDARARIVEFNKNIADKGASALASAEEILRAQNAKTKTAYIVGDPAQKLVELSGDADLMVCGSRGLNPVQGFFLGSVSDSVVRHARCPVLLYRGQEAPVPRPEEKVSLTVGFDDTRSSEAACEFLTCFTASGLRNIDLVSVLQLNFNYGMSYSLSALESWPEYRKSLEEKLSETSAILSGPQGLPPVRTHIISDASDISEALNQHALKNKSDLIVVGSKGKNLLDRIVIGSISNRLAHHSSVPLLIVR